MGGVDIILDTVGGDTLSDSIRSMARGGRLIAIGQASRAPVVVDLKELYARGLRLSGFKLDIASHRVREAIQKSLDAVASGELDAVIDRSFSLADTASAHTHVENRLAFGRVVLTP